MGKPKNSNAVEHNEVKYDDPRMSHMGTHSDFVKKISNVRINELNSDIGFKDFLVIAEDQAGLYVTCKSYIDSHTLDTYRTFNRKFYTVTAGENDTYNVTYLPTNNTVVC